MFEKIDLSKTVDDKMFDKSLPPLKERLGILQRTLRDQNILNMETIRKALVLMFLYGLVANHQRHQQNLMVLIQYREIALNAIHTHLAIGVDENRTSSSASLSSIWCHTLRSVPRS
jgi:hypothetical protein